MAETRTASNRFAVVTGANKGIGFEICRQLASNGIMVVLTARDEKRGTEALEILKGSGLSDLVVFHQLDVANTSSIASLADFVKTHFGRLDILVNNAGISGALVNWDAFKATGAPAAAGSRDQINWNELMTQTYELAKECLETNYYGAKGMIEAFIPLLQLSDSPRIVNVSSGMGKLKVNNAGIMGAMVDWDAIKISLDAGSELKLNEVMTQTYELTKECLETNYYGAKRMIDAFIPLLQLSNSPRIVNISSVRGKLKYIPSEWAKGELNDTEGLTEERIEEVLKVFLKDFKDGSVETKGWPPLWSAYTVSKAALNSYTRILAEKYPTFRINCVCPGSVKTDINSNNGKLGAEEGAASVVTLALVPKDGPSGLFFDQKEVASFVERVFLVAGFS